jgi:hypothetical protein
VIHGRQHIEPEHLELEVLAKDRELLCAVAGFRLAIVSQLCAWLSASEQMVRRRSRKLIAGGLLATSPRGFGRRGRPESVFAVTNTGANFLRKEGILHRNVPCNRVTGDALASMIEHQILLNWVAIECARLHRHSDKFSVQFISSTSPRHVSATGATVLYDRISKADGSEVAFVPDAAFCITRRRDGKSLLFFVEVDMGTEAVTRRKADSNVDVQQKIASYRTYLGGRGYKRYESQAAFNVRSHGFRLLIVVNSTRRRDALGEFMRRSPHPCGFVWTCDNASLTRDGIAGKIWMVGGRMGEAPRSILSGERQPADTVQTTSRSSQTQTQGARE